MESTKETSHYNRYAVSALVVILVLAGVFRYRMLDVPFERDEGGYAYAGQLILQGIPPYREYFGMRLPGVYAIYAASMAVFGQTHQAIHLALLITNAITTIFVYLLARRLVSTLTAVTSAASFALLSLGQPVQGVFANTEHFVIVFVAGGMLLLLRGIHIADSESEAVTRSVSEDQSSQRKTKSRLRIGLRSANSSLFVSGVLFGLAVVVKHHGIVFCGLAAACVLVHAFQHRPIPWKRAFLQVAVVAGGALSILFVLCILMASVGQLGAMWFWTVEYAATYVKHVPMERAWLYLKMNCGAIFSSGAWLWSLAALGLACPISRRLVQTNRMLILLFALFSVLAVCPGFYFRPHYFVLLLPCAGLLIGTAVGAVANLLATFNTKIRWGIPIAVIVACLSQSIYQQRNFLFQMTALDVSRTTYWPNPFPESLKIAEFIKKNTNRKDRVVVLGSEPQIYFYSQRRASTGHVHMYPLMENHEFSQQMQRDLIEQVEANKPEIIVYVGVPTSWLRRPDSHTDLLVWSDRLLRSGKFKLIGMVELFQRRTVFRWNEEASLPSRARFWVAIFKRSA